MDVPVATNASPNSPGFFCAIFGQHLPFDQPRSTVCTRRTVRTSRRSPAWRGRNVRDGYLLRRDARALVREAAASEVGSSPAPAAPLPRRRRATRPPPLRASGPVPRLPHPIPYQGSKRLLASRILATVAGRPPFAALYEPFAGSAAVTLAAADAGVADRYVLGDSLPELIDIWQAVIASPGALADDYAAIWHEQEAAGRSHFDRVRADFNAEGGAARLLYLLARCVKNAPRFGPNGFSQSADHRRTGVRPERMRRQIESAHRLLAGRTTALAGDACETLRSATPGDLVYLDPPWQGTTEGRDKRYHQGLARDRLIELLET